jgi:LAS superfamily LD-carboxypeptidase LdcB
MLSVNGCLLERDAAYMFALMEEAAEKQGITLGAMDCYRTYSRQKAAWESRCPLVEREVKAFDPQSGTPTKVVTRQRECSGPPTARPGHSNHSWGRAIDFSDGYGVLTCTDEDFLWLQGHAHEFGWVHPPWAHCGQPLEEAWHWEWAGVIEATLVPDYAAIWTFGEITMARIGAGLSQPVPLPAIGYGDSEYWDRWLELFGVHGKPRHFLADD